MIIPTVTTRVRKVRAMCRRAEEIAISVVRNPDSTMEDVKLMRETLLEIDKQVARVDKSLCKANICVGGRPLTIRGKLRL